MLKINTDKTSEKVKKDPKRQERGKKAYETHMKKLKKQILKDNQLLTPSPTNRPTPSNSSSTGNSTPSTPSSTGNSTLFTPSHTTRPNDTYVYGVGILAVVAIGVCIFFACNTFQPRNKNSSMKNRINHHNVICFRSYIIN